MKAVVSIFIVQEDFEVDQLTNTIMEETAQHWPTFTVEVRDATEDEKEWFQKEYADPMGWSSVDPAEESDVSIYGAGSA